MPASPQNKPECGVAGDIGEDPFHEDNRMGVEGTLHRISAIRNRDKQKSVIGLTYRIGRHMPGARLVSCSHLVLISASL